MPGPRWWEYRIGWNLPTPAWYRRPEASFVPDAENTQREIHAWPAAAWKSAWRKSAPLEWDITLTTDAAKAYQGDYKAMRDFGERKAQAKKFFRRPDPDFWNFDSFLNAFLEEIFVYDALSLIFRPEIRRSIRDGRQRAARQQPGQHATGLRTHDQAADRPARSHPERSPPLAYQQFLFGVPRSDYLSVLTGQDLEDSGLADEEFKLFGSDVMLYAPYWRRRETPYGLPPVERALLPIISGLQKQEFQLDYFTEGTVPAVYISPGDPNISPNQIGELQNALNALAGDPAYHLKVVVLPPGSKVEPQRPVDLCDSFDYLVMNQVLMSFDCQPTELGIIPDIGGDASWPWCVRYPVRRPAEARYQVPGEREAACSSGSATSSTTSCRTSASSRICSSSSRAWLMMRTRPAITELGVQQIQNGMATIDEVRERLDLPPFGH